MPVRHPCIKDYTKGERHAGRVGVDLPGGVGASSSRCGAGLGSVLTTLHLPRAPDAAELLGIPDGVLQAGLVPVAYYTGDDFKPAKRHPIEDVTSWNRWGNRR